MKKILVPCDFSEPAVEAFKFAVDLVTQSGGEIDILTVIGLPAMYNPAVPMSFETDYMNDAKAAAEEKLEKMTKKWASDGQRVKSIVAFGDLQATILETAQQIKSDLVVVGTHGASGLKEFTIGSNTEKIVRTIGVPVIAIKKAPKEIKSIVFPTTPDLDQEELTMKVKELQNFLKATLHVLFVNTPATFGRDLVTKPALAELAKRFMLKNFTLNIYNDISEEEGIINFSKDIKADMVAMRTHGRRGLAHIAMGSIAEDVVNHIACPIWTLKIR